MLATLDGHAIVATILSALCRQNVQSALSVFIVFAFGGVEKHLGLQLL
jgi:hypothetical protein